MNIRKVVAALFLASSSWVAAADPPQPYKPAKYEYDHMPFVKFNVSKLDPGELECLRSSQTSLGTRFSWQFKGFCEPEKGVCFWARLLHHAGIIDNWQCWQRDDGWWQADATLLGFYKHTRKHLNKALSEVSQWETDCV